MLVSAFSSSEFLHAESDSSYRKYGGLIVKSFTHKPGQHE